MPISQTMSELGLERGVVAAWSEPRSGQTLKPRFGARPFPRKLIFAVLLVIAYVGIVSWNDIQDLSTVALLIGASLVFVVIAWPLLVILDRVNKRNVWVYVDQILVTHARDRVVLPKSELKEAILYRANNPEDIALEFILTNGKSTVVGVPSEVDPTTLIATLRGVGYQVRSDL